MNPLLKIQNFFIYFFKGFSPIEKSLLLIFLVIGLLSTVTVSRHHYLNTTHEVPEEGGVFSEGLVVAKPELDQILNQLSKSSLLYLDKDGKINGELASSFKVSDDAKKFTLDLRDGVSADEILARVRERQDLFANIEVGKEGEKTIVFSLRQAYGPFLYTLTTPIFDNGPYLIKSQDNKEVKLEANPQFNLGQPFISEIDFKLYADKEHQITALRRREITAMFGGEISNLSGYHIVKMVLPQYLVLFFNLDNPTLNSLDTRTKLANFDNLPLGLHLTLVTTKQDESLSFTNNLKKKWEEKGAKIELQTYDTETLDKEIIPARRFDILITGIDLGRENDPNPFWHSKETGKEGKNFSDFKNAQMDQALEGLRKKITVDDLVAAWLDVTKIIQDQKPAIILDQKVASYAVSDAVNGISDKKISDSPSRFNEVWKWYLKTKRVKIN